MHSHRQCLVRSDIQHACVWNESFIRVTRRIPTCDMTHSMWTTIDIAFSNAGDQKLLNNTCDMTDSYALYIYTCDMTHWYVRHQQTYKSCDSFISMIWRIHMCDRTHSYVWHDSFIRVIWRIRTCNMTRYVDMNTSWHVLNKARAIPRKIMRHVTHMNKSRQSLNQRVASGASCHETLDSHAYVTWRIHIWHDTFISDTTHLEIWSREQCRVHLIPGL